MRYKDELRIAGVTALFCCAMLMITAVVPKDTTVAKARKTFKEAPETAADAEAQAQSEAEDAGFTVYTEAVSYTHLALLFNVWICPVNIFISCCVFLVVSKLSSNFFLFG